MKKKIRDRIGNFLITIGLCMSAVGAIFYVNSTRDVTCTKQNLIWNIEKKFEINIHGKVEAYEYIVNTDYSNLNDDEFNELCNEIDNEDLVVGSKFKKEMEYCEEDKKQYVSYKKFNYNDDLLNSIYGELYKDELKFVNHNKVLDEEAWMEYMQNNGYQCKR